MERLTIGEVSRLFCVSTRTLRYYEQLGLLRAERKEDNAYRSYGEDAVERLKQIIVLRKLRIPLKSIAEIVETRSTALAIDVLQASLVEIGDEIDALSMIKNVVREFIERLGESGEPLRLPDDESLLEIVDSLTSSEMNFNSINLKEEKKTMDELEKAGEKLDKLTDRNVRIIHVPPATVAAAHYIGDGPEGPASETLNAFIENTNLREMFPEARCYGFNHPNPGMRDDGKYGYEFWVTIPDDMEVPAPLAKKRFEGGLYAAYMILSDELDGTGWHRLFEWAQSHSYWELYADDAGNLTGSGENMFDLLEEHLNIFQWTDHADFQQFDLLMPIRRKVK